MAGKLFLTGGAGMVGRNIRDHPSAVDWEILAPSSCELDPTDPAAVAAWLAQVRPDLVVHAAGKVGGIGANMAEPVAFLDRNVTIGRNVIMGARAAGVRRLINLGTSCMYPRAAPNPLCEDDLLTGELEPTNEGYALAKIVALRLCDYIRREDARFLYKTLVPCNLYGPHDTFDVERAHLVPAIIAKVHAAKTAGLSRVEIWGDGTARREFMYAGDLADAVYRAARDLEALPGHMNVGAGEDRSIAEYYAIAARAIGWEGAFTHDPEKPAGMARKLCDITRQTEWGWRPRTPLDEGIVLTYRHFLKEVAA